MFTSCVPIYMETYPSKAMQIFNQVKETLKRELDIEPGPALLSAQYFSKAVKKDLRQGLPVISVDTKKKELIGKTTTAKGLKVTCRLDRRKYFTGRKVTVEEMKHINIKRNRFHGEWNYMIKPKVKNT